MEYRPDGRTQTERYVSAAMAKVAAGEQVAFATVRKGGGTADRVVGSTRFYEVATWQWPEGSAHQRVGVPDVGDIGYTWLAVSAQRSPVNTEAKLLMLGHAFEVWQVHRVGFQTDERNTRSSKAIERIGGRLDGLLRRRYARHRRHGAHVGPLLHPDGRVAGGEGTLDVANGVPAESCSRADQARAREAEILRRCRSRTAASASSLVGSPPRPSRCGGSSRPSGRPAPRSGGRSRRKPGSPFGRW